MNLQVNTPPAVASLTASFHRYETALIDGNVNTMGELFWSSPSVTRFGTNDYQVGQEELAAFRASRGPLPPGRQLEDTRILTFGDDFGIVTTLVRTPRSNTIGRQSQTWIRIEGTWQIAHAHVSQTTETSPDATTMR